MLPVFSRYITAGWFFLAAAILAPSATADEPFVEEAKKHSWFSFSKPDRDNPSDQMDYALTLMKDGKLKKAGKAFRSLVITWPSARETPLAQWSYARILDERGKYEDAFDAYQDLLDKHGGRFPEYDNVLERQFEIAKTVMGKRRGVLFFGGFKAPERAIPMFESIIRNGPRSPFAAEAQYLIGEAYESNFDHELAVVAFSATLHRYPLSPFAEKASFARAKSLDTYAQAYPNNVQLLEEAWAAVMAFLRAYPESDMRDDATLLRDELLKKRAKRAYDIAYYYDRITKRPNVALESYREFVQLYTDTEWTATAQERIAALEHVATNVTEGIKSNE